MALVQRAPLGLALGRVVGWRRRISAISARKSRAAPLVRVRLQAAREQLAGRRRAQQHQRAPQRDRRAGAPVDGAHAEQPLARARELLAARARHPSIASENAASPPRSAAARRDAQATPPSSAASSSPAAAERQRGAGLISPALIIPHSSPMSAPDPPFTAEHEELRESVRGFIERELAPHAQQWEEDALVPERGLPEAGRAGPARPEVPRAEYGGQGGDYLHEAVLCEEMARIGSGGAAAGIGAHINIATPPIWKFGTEEQKQRYLVPSIAGELIGALGITEPGAGSDVAAIAHARRARRRRLARQRREDLHHQRRARRLHRHGRQDDAPRAATAASRS